MVSLSPVGLVKCGQGGVGDLPEEIRSLRLCRAR